MWITIAPFVTPEKCRRCNQSAVPVSELISVMKQTKEL
ncbi:hypothetical protein AA98_5136 [Escherichia coli 2-011-08_S1_C1]|nr:hypothetical protein AA98_5136 [Escherichia coli 2-011-08_S1_C1]